MAQTFHQPIKGLETNANGKRLAVCLFREVTQVRCVRKADADRGAPGRGGRRRITWPRARTRFEILAHRRAGRKHDTVVLRRRRGRSAVRTWGAISLIRRPCRPFAEARHAHRRPHRPSPQAGADPAPRRAGRPADRAPADAADAADRPGGGVRGGGGPPAQPRRAVADPHRPRWGRQDPARAGDSTRHGSRLRRRRRLRRPRPRRRPRTRPSDRGPRSRRAGGRDLADRRSARGGPDPAASPAGPGQRRAGARRGARARRAAGRLPRRQDARDQQGAAAGPRRTGAARAAPARAGPPGSGRAPARSRRAPGEPGGCAFRRSGGRGGPGLRANRGERCRGRRGLPPPRRAPPGD